MLKEEIIIQHEYKHLNILKDGRFVQGALVNNAKVEYDGQNKMRITASLEGHKILDTDWIYIQEKYTYAIVEDEVIHQLRINLSDIKVAYAVLLKATQEKDDKGFSKFNEESLLRLVVIFGNFVKRSKQ